jgi:mannose/cellobiose epimerase-like protein (N-acyl-D-glucosamine 2-epimerase family)
MDILKALRTEETKFLRQMDAAKQQLETVRAAIKVFRGNGSTATSSGRKKRFVSKAARAKMAKAQRRRWAKIKAAKKNS